MEWGKCYENPFALNNFVLTLISRWRCQRYHIHIPDGGFVSIYDGFGYAGRARGVTLINS